MVFIYPFKLLHNSQVEIIAFSLKLLLVIQEMMQAMLSQLGLKMHLAENGLQAITKAQELLPDLILMDMHMPEMGGLEATDKIREIATLQDTPIVALSADAFKNQQHRAFRKGVNDYLTKPIDFEKLFPVLVKYLKKEEVTMTDKSSKEKKSLSPEELQLIEERIRTIENTPIFETKLIVGYLNEIRKLVDGTGSPYTALCDKIEDAVFVGDEEILKELLDKVE